MELWILILIGTPLLLLVLVGLWLARLRMGKNAPTTDDRERPKPTPTVKVTVVPAAHGKSDHAGHSSHGGGGWSSFFGNMAVVAVIVLIVFHVVWLRGAVYYVVSWFLVPSSSAASAQLASGNVSGPQPVTVASVTPTQEPIQCPDDGSYFNSLEPGARVQLVVPQGKTIHVLADVGALSVCSGANCAANDGSVPAGNVETVINQENVATQGFRCFYTDEPDVGVTTPSPNGT